MLPIYTTQNRLSLKKCVHLPTAYLNKQWNQSSAKELIPFILMADSEKIFFGVALDFVPTNFLNIKKGTFQKGLATKDVFELFLREDNSNRYQEFHLSPSGAWWSATFTAPRQGEREVIERERVEVLIENGGGVFFVGISFPRSMLQIEIAFNEKSAGNVCCCIGSPEQSYLSYATLKGDKPDFHQPQCFSTFFPILVS